MEKVRRENQNEEKYRFFPIALMFSGGASVAAEKKQENLVWDAGPVQLELEQLGDGVYTYCPADTKEKNPKGYPVATSGGFVAGDKSVLVADSMVNARLGGKGRAGGTRYSLYR